MGRENSKLREAQNRSCRMEKQVFIIQTVHTAKLTIPKRLLRIQIPSSLLEEMYLIMLAISSLLEELGTMIQPEGAIINKTIEETMEATETMGTSREMDIKMETLDQPSIASKRMEENRKLSEETEMIDMGIEEVMIDTEITDKEIEIIPEIKPSADSIEATLEIKEEVVVSRNHRCQTWLRSI